MVAIAALRGQVPAPGTGGGAALMAPIRPRVQIAAHPGRAIRAVGLETALNPGLGPLCLGGDGILPARRAAPGRVWPRSLPLPIPAPSPEPSRASMVALPASPRNDRRAGSSATRRPGETRRSPGRPAPLGSASPDPAPPHRRREALPGCAAPPHRTA